MGQADARGDDVHLSAVGTPAAYLELLPAGHGRTGKDMLPYHFLVIPGGHVDGHLPPQPVRVRDAPEPAVVV